MPLQMQLQILSRLTLLQYYSKHLKDRTATPVSQFGPSKSHPKPDNAILAGAEITKTLT